MVIYYFASVIEGRSHDVGYNLFLFAPLILLADLLFFRWGKVVLDVEGLTNFLRGLALDHVSHGFAGHIKESL